MRAVTVDSRQVELERAQEIIAGYAFGTREPAFTPPKPTIGEKLAAQAVPRWGYKTYDCVPPSDAPELTDHDLLVAAGLNGRIDVDAMGGLQSVRDEAAQVLGSIPDGTKFWDLDRDALGSKEPPRTMIEWSLQRAWFVLMSAPHVGPALTHKVLHHKRPTVFPLLDGETLREFSPGHSWQEIHEQVKDPSFEQLEQWFARRPKEEGEVDLKRLRLHDILLWCYATGDADYAAVAGREWLQVG